MPARTTADINIEYPDHGSYTYFTSRINNFYNAIFWGEGRYYHASMGEAGSYVNADIIYDNPPYPQMEYKFRIHSSDSPVAFSITDKYIIIPQQNIGKEVSNKNNIKHRSFSFRLALRNIIQLKYRKNIRSNQYRYRESNKD